MSRAARPTRALPKASTFQLSRLRVDHKPALFEISERERSVALTFPLERHTTLRVNNLCMADIETHLNYYCLLGARDYHIARNDSQDTDVANLPQLLELVIDPLALVNREHRITCHTRERPI